MFAHEYNIAPSMARPWDIKLMYEGTKRKRVRTFIRRIHAGTILITRVIQRSANCGRRPRITKRPRSLPLHFHAFGVSTSLAIFIKSLGQHTSLRSASSTLWGDRFRSERVYRFKLRQNVRTQADN